MKNRKLTNFRIPEGILSRLDKYAEEEHRTRTSALEIILDRALPQLDKAKEQQKEGAEA